MKKVTKTNAPDNPRITNAETLGQFIRAHRTAAGLTIEEASLIVGIAKQTFADLERGKPTVSLGIVLRVAAEMGLGLFVAEKHHAKAVSDFIQLRQNEIGRIR